MIMMFCLYDLCHQSLTCSHPCAHVFFHDSPPLNESVELNATLNPLMTLQLNGSVSVCILQI